MTVAAEAYVSKIPLKKFSLWGRKRKRNWPVSFELELTARCNLDCRHCYINLPADDKEARENELSFPAIKGIVDQAVSLGAVWCLLTGGEPLLRKDFFEIYLYLKKKGVLVSLFTNASLINAKHINFFKKYPPRDIEVTVYGVTEDVYERISRGQGSFLAFSRGLNLLLESKIKVRLKAMALRSNVHQLPEISEFCRKRNKDYFRFDPLLHLRFDGNQQRNEEIKSERLSPREIADIEQADQERSQALINNCTKFINSELKRVNHRYLFTCGSGKRNFCVSSDGLFRLCSSLWHQNCLYDLNNGTLEQALLKFVPFIRGLTSSRQEFLNKCRNCEIINLCMWCPAHAYLENGALDVPVSYFCEVANARAEKLRERMVGR